MVGGKAGRRTHAASVSGAVCLVTCSVVAHVHCMQRGVKEACSGVEVPFSPVLLGQRTRQRRLAARELNILVFHEVPRHSHGELEGRVRRTAWGAQVHEPRVHSTAAETREMASTCLLWHLPIQILTDLGGRLCITRVLLISNSIFPSRKQGARCGEGFLAAVKETLD